VIRTSPFRQQPLIGLLALNRQEQRDRPFLLGPLCRERGIGHRPLLEHCRVLDDPFAVKTGRDRRGTLGVVKGRVRPLPRLLEQSIGALACQLHDLIRVILDSRRPFQQRLVRLFTLRPQAAVGFYPLGIMDRIRGGHEAS